MPRPRRLGEKDRELLAAPTTDGVRRARGPLEEVGELLQHEIAAGIVEAGVDLREVVEVEEKEGERPTGSPRAREFSVELFVVAATVANSREPIGNGSKLGFGEAARVGDARGRIVSESLKCARVLGPERCGSACVCSECAGLDPFFDYGKPDPIGTPPPLLRAREGRSS